MAQNSDTASTVAKKAAADQAAGDSDDNNGIECRRYRDMFEEICKEERFQPKPDHVSTELIEQELEYASQQYEPLNLSRIQDILLNDLEYTKTMRNLVLKKMFLAAELPLDFLHDVDTSQALGPLTGFLFTLFMYGKREHEKEILSEIVDAKLKPNSAAIIAELVMSMRYNIKETLDNEDDFEEYATFSDDFQSVRLHTGDVTLSKKVVQICLEITDDENRAWLTKVDQKLKPKPKPKQKPEPSKKRKAENVMPLTLFIHGIKQCGIVATTQVPIDLKGCELYRFVEQYFEKIDEQIPTKGGEYLELYTVNMASGMRNVIEHERTLLEQDIDMRVFARITQSALIDKRPCLAK